jgi:hypothetical protein
MQFGRIIQSVLPQKSDRFGTVSRINFGVRNARGACLDNARNLV